MTMTFEQALLALKILTHMWIEYMESDLVNPHDIHGYNELMNRLPEILKTLGKVIVL